MPSWKTYKCYKLVFWKCLHHLHLLLCLSSAERKPLPGASPNSPRLHRPDHLRPRWSAAPGRPICYHVHGDPLRPPATRLHHGSAALAHGHPVARLPPGPPGGQTANGRPPPHTLTGRGTRSWGGRGGWVLVFQTNRSEEAKATGTAYTWDSQTMRVCVRGLTGPKAGKN